MSLFSLPAAARNSFGLCAVELLESGIAPDQAAAACASALEPDNLSLCVLEIQAYTSVAAEAALNSCFRTRRPPDLAECVIDINDNTRDPNATAALDYCRRSLLPIRFSNCVIGISGEVDLTAVQAMEACIDAETYPPRITTSPNPVNIEGVE